MHPVKLLIRACLVLASLVALPTLAAAQTADIVGRVMDNSGAVLPGATVTVTETLLSGDRYAGTGAGEALEFNLAGTFTLTNLTAHFSLGSGVASASAFHLFCVPRAFAPIRRTST